MSAKPCLRGGGDVLSRRLASLRADILARGKPSLVVSWNGERPIQNVRPSMLPRVFAYLRSRGVSVCNVMERRTLCGLSCFVDNRGVDWLLLTEPVLLFSERVSASKKPLGV